MNVDIENIELDKENIEFNNAAEFVKHTDELIYLTGKAGTGKTTFLKYIKNNTKKETVILAPTGVAAINAGGVTINSFFQIPFGPFLPNDYRLRVSSLGSGNSETIFSNFKYKEEKKKIIESMELLIIDEISMVRADTLDVIDKLLRVFRKINHLPFGGVQVILIGDTFQLPPIVDKDQGAILSQFYKTPFFFSAKVIEDNTPVYIELKKIYRQKEQEFIDLLNKVRVNKVDQSDLQLLNAKVNSNINSDNHDYIILETHNKNVYDTNSNKLKQLTTPLFTYNAKITGVFSSKTMPTDQFLDLKVGAQIMFVKNDTGVLKKYYNGKIGKIKSLDDDEIIVAFDDDSEVIVDKIEWENIQYSYNKESKRIEVKVIGTFEQFPLRLAWAITVHKSQGLTFEKVIANLSNAFAPGQVYVALSRCTSLSGLVLKSHIGRHTIKTDYRVLEFAQNETPSTLMIDQLNKGKADFYYKKAREGYKTGEFNKSYDQFLKALKFRNDIETEQFKRYILVNLKRLFSFRKGYANILKTLKSKEEMLGDVQVENQQLTDQLSSKSDTISVLQSDIGSLQKELHLKEDQNKELQSNVDLSSVLVQKSENKYKEINNLLDKKEEQNKELQSNVDLSTDLLQKVEKKYKELNKFLDKKVDKIKIHEERILDLENTLKHSVGEYNTVEDKNVHLNSLIKEIREENDTLKAEVSRLKKIKWYNKLMGK